MTAATSTGRLAAALDRVIHDTPKNTSMDSTSESPDMVTPAGKLYAPV